MQLRMTVETAIEQFREAAISKGDFVSDSSRDHALHSQMAEAVSFLKSHDDLAIQAFRSLLHDENNHVRLWVASFFTCRDDAEAMEVLAKLGLLNDMVGFAARMTIDQYVAGILQPPFKLL